MREASFLLATLIFLGLASSQVSGTAKTMKSKGMEVVVLGVTQDGGVPHLGCEKTCCVGARESGLRMGPSSLGVIDHDREKLMLFDATPAVESQIAFLHRQAGFTGRGRKVVDAIALTHAHIGHYLGLAHFGREVASSPAIPLFVSARMGKFISENGPWSQLVDLENVVLNEAVPGKPFQPWPGLEVVPVPVPHRDEFSDTMAFKIQGPSQTVLYIPDIDAWEGVNLDTLFGDVDVAYVDATWYDGRELPGRDITKIPHPPIVKSLEVLKDWIDQHPGGLRFIHLNHTNPALFDPEIRALIEAKGASVAAQGETVRL